MSVQGTQTVGSIWCLNFSATPSSGAGIASPLGSFGSVNDGSGFYFKTGALDTNWTQLRSALGYTPINKAGDSGIGNLTFLNNHGIDADLSGGTDTLNIGTSNADVINIGWSGTTINFVGTPVFSGVIAIANGGTNSNSQTAPVGGIAPIMFFDGTKIAGDTTPSHLGYDESTDTVYTSHIIVQTASSQKGISIINTVTSGSASGAGFGLYSNDSSALASGDRFGYILLGGNDGSSPTVNSCGIQGFTTEAWSNTAHGSKLTLETTPNGSTTRGVAVTVDQDKKVILASSINESQGANIASASTTDIGAATGNYVNITGTTTITSFGTVQAGTRRVVNFNGILTLTYNATSLILPTSANITTAAGDTATFVSLGSGNWVCVMYERVDGKSLYYQGYSLNGQMVGTNVSPADATTYYGGVFNGQTLNTVAAVRRFYFPKNGTVKAVSLFANFVAGSNETSTCSIRISNTTDYSISTTMDCSSAPLVVNNQSLSITVTTSDYFEIKWLTPTWATNPTVFNMGFVVYVE